MKTPTIPKYLRKPPTTWGSCGLARTIKVLAIQAALERSAGNKEAERALRKMVTAFKAALRQRAPVAESVTLGWPAEGE